MDTTESLIVQTVPAVSFLDFSLRKNLPAGKLDRLGRLPLFHDGNFVTATDGVHGPWGFAQQYWAQYWPLSAEKPMAYPDKETGCILTQVIFVLDADGDWCVAEENQFAPIVGSGLPPAQFKKFSLVFTGCKFCPSQLVRGANFRQSSGAAQWKQFNPDGSVLHQALVPWRYDVALDGSTGDLDEVYFQNGLDAFAYWKQTKMAIGIGDTEIRDVLAGFTSKVNL